MTGSGRERETGAVVLIPGARHASAAVVVLGPGAGCGPAFAAHGGFEDVVVLAPGDPFPRVVSIAPAGRREGGPDALVAAAAVLGSAVASRQGRAEPAGDGRFRLELAAPGETSTLTPGIVGAALGLDPEFVSDTGRRPCMVRLPEPVLVVPVEDRQSVEEARPVPDVLARLVPGHLPELVVLLVTGPDGTSLPDPLPVSVFRDPTWPRPAPASVMAAAAIAALPDLLAPGTSRDLLFTPARGDSAGDPPTMRVARDAHGAITIVTGAERVI